MPSPDALPTGIAMIIFVVGIILAVIGSLSLLLTAFSESVLWGLAFLFVPLAGVRIPACSRSVRRPDTHA